MATNINDIVNVSITLEKPVQTTSSFGVVLLIGPGPINPAEGIDDISVYAELDMLLRDGYKEDEPVYIAAKVAFAQEPTPELMYVCIRKQEGSQTEDIEVTLERAMEHGGWYGACAVGFSTEDINKTAAFIEKTEKIFSFTTRELTAILTEKKYLRTHGWYTNETAPEDIYLHVAVMAKCMGYDPGSETWAMKSLSMVNPSNITSPQAKSLDESNMNYYVKIANANVTQNGKMIGDEWIDIIRFRDWQKNDMQLGIYNFIRQKKKLPYTDDGITAIDAQMIASLKRGVEAGGIAADDYDEEGNKVPGYSTSVPSAAQISAAQKQSRKLPGCKWSAKLAGAIQAVEIKGTLSY